MKRQNSQLFPSADEPTMDYRYLDVTSEGEVLPPIRRNDRIDEGEDDLTRPQRPIIYYPNVDSAERNTYYPEEEKVEKEDRNKRPLRPYKPKQVENHYKHVTSIVHAKMYTNYLARVYSIGGLKRFTFQQ